jgi:hypothetical protein
LFDMNDRSPSWDAGRDRWQTVRNERPIPPAESQRSVWPPVEVVAWVVWERDGLELIDTTAHAYAGRDVRVELTDVRRAQVKYLWLAAQDVRRR